MRTVNTFDAPKVLNGIGKPEIIVQQDTYIYNSTGATTYGVADGVNYVEETGASYPDTVAVGGVVHAKSAAEERTASILSIDGIRLYVSAWSDETAPSNGDGFRIKDIRLILPIAAITEIYRPVKMQQKNQFGTVFTIDKGFDYFAVLDYSQIVYGGMIKGIESVLAISPDENVNLVLIPYTDEQRVQRPVNLIGDITLLKLAQKHGHLNFRLEFEGKERYANVPTFGTGWGFIYATAWGSHTF